MFISHARTSDATPWRQFDTGERISQAQYEAAAAAGGALADLLWSYDPRPELAVGRPNPILTTFRERTAMDPEFEHNSLWSQAQDALDAVQGNDITWWCTQTGQEVTAEHLAHAGKVLAKLVALTAPVPPEWNPLEMVVAQALWFSDMANKAITTHWNDLGEVGQEAYRKDAAGLLRAFELGGLAIVPAHLLRVEEIPARA